MDSNKPEPGSFQDAASYLSNAASLSKVSNATKLELYGLFKWITVSPNPNTSRPSIFDMTGRAKWDAWAAAGKRHMHKADAEARYLEIARDLGWQPGSGSSKAEEEEERGDIWDKEEGSGTKKKGGGGGELSFAPGVSSMAVPETEVDNTLHGLALDGDAKKLDTLIALDPGIDLNTPDEFGYTPLHLACDRGNIEIVKLLLEKGADLSIKDPDDLTPVELARVAGHEEIAAILSKRNTV